MALDRGELWWLPALYLQKAEVEDGAQREVNHHKALGLARMQESRSLEKRILASMATI